MIMSSNARTIALTMNTLILFWDLFFLTCTVEKPRDKDIWSVDLGNKTEKSCVRKNKQGTCGV